MSEVQEAPAERLPFAAADESDVDFDGSWRRSAGRSGPRAHGCTAWDDHQRGLAGEELRCQLGSPRGGFELHGRAYGARGALP